jgi:hypothetical protein
MDGANQTVMSDRMVLANDCRRAHFKTSLVGYRVRQLRQQGLTLTLR